MKTFRISTLDYTTVLNIASRSQGNDICLDFSSLKFVQSDGLVFLTLFLKSDLVSGLQIQAVLPEIKREEQCPFTYLKRMHFFEKTDNIILSDEDGSKLSELRNIHEHLSRDFTPLLDTMDEYSIGEDRDILDNLIANFINLLQEHFGLSPTVVTHLKQLITETFSNLVEHAHPDAPTLPYYCSQIQRYRQRQGFRLAIGDLGVGIKDSLNTIHNFQTDFKALTAVVHRGVSRMSNQNQERGGGIKYVFEIAEILNLGCRLRSGNAEILIDHRGVITGGSGAWFPGTQLFVWK